MKERKWRQIADTDIFVPINKLRRSRKTDDAQDVSEPLGMF